MMPHLIKGVRDGCCRNRGASLYLSLHPGHFASTMALSRMEPGFNRAFTSLSVEADRHDRFQMVVSIPDNCSNRGIDDGWLLHRKVSCVAYSSKQHETQWNSSAK